jgi:predicted aspartyl protease
LKFSGGIGPGGVGFITVNLMCEQYGINAPIRFFVDTGCSVTTIGLMDAQRIGINYNVLTKSLTPTITANGNVFPYILPKCGIFFSLPDALLLEYIGNANVSTTNPISVLGLDILKRFSIRFTMDNVILER